MQYIFASLPRFSDYYMRWRWQTHFVFRVLGIWLIEAGGEVRRTCAFIKLFLFHSPCPLRSVPRLIRRDSAVLCNLIVSANNREFEPPPYPKNKLRENKFDLELVLHFPSLGALCILKSILLLSINNMIALILLGNDIEIIYNA